MVRVLSFGTHVVFVQVLYVWYLQGIHVVCFGGIFNVCVVYVWCLLCMCCILSVYVRCMCVSVWCM